MDNGVGIDCGSGGGMGGGGQRGKNWDFNRITIKIILKINKRLLSNGDTKVRYYTHAISENHIGHFKPLIFLLLMTKAVKHGKLNQKKYIIFPSGP